MSQMSQIKPGSSSDNADNRRGSAQSVLIVGATSAIARALAGELASSGAAVHLAARNVCEAGRIANDLSVRYQVPTSCSRFEAGAWQEHEEFFAQAVSSLGKIDLVIVSIGELYDQSEAQNNPELALNMIQSNYTGVVSLMTYAANYLEARRQGAIVCIASVAGDRGRMSNYIYGSAKAGLAAFLSGLRSRLFKAGVHVMTVKPGFVDTKMTFGKPAMFLVAKPKAVAAAILKALRQGKDEVYVPWFWAYIMLIIRSVPEAIFKRTKL